jgi:hypothetical protein
LLIGRNVNLGTWCDWNIFTVASVASADFWAFLFDAWLSEKLVKISSMKVNVRATDRVKRDGQRPAGLKTLSFPGIVDDGLMILFMRGVC